MHLRSLWLCLFCLPYGTLQWRAFLNVVHILFCFVFSQNEVLLRSSQICHHGLKDVLIISFYFKKWKRGLSHTNHHFPWNPVCSVASVLSYFLLHRTSCCPSGKSTSLLLFWGNFQEPAFVEVNILCPHMWALDPNQADGSFSPWPQNLVRYILMTQTGTERWNEANSRERNGEAEQVFTVLRLAA